MKSTFAQCLAFTLRFEGGEVDDPRDPGGRTKEGVTQRTYSQWRSKCGLGSRDVYAMEPAERDTIYQSGFWVPIKGDLLPAGVDLAVFDFGVNSGPARALKAYAKRGSNDATATVKTVCAGRLSFLHALGTFKTFGRGWTARVAACEALAVKMAEHARIGVPVDAPIAPQVASTMTAEGTAAKGKAAAQRKAAAGSGAGGAVVAASAPAAHLPWEAWAVPLLLVGLAVALLAWRASQHSARAAAYLALATPSV